MLERYGPLAVFGRQPTPREMRRMNIVDRIRRAYFDRKASADWAKWANENKSENDLLNWAMRLANG